MTSIIARQSENSCCLIDVLYDDQSDLDGPNDVLIGEFGPHEGTITPRYARYWFENVGEDDLEILQVGAYTEGAESTGRTDSTPQRYEVGNSHRFERVVSKAEA